MSKHAKSRTRLSPAKSARLVRVDQALKLAIEVFGDVMAREWMATRILELGDRTPLDLLDTDTGLQLVLDTLGRISYGAPA